ncbi:MAG TPA: YceI family protein [Streptosporangiaceae bacterium]|jgi:polyisoprenoid-binding protein YceI
MTQPASDTPPAGTYRLDPAGSTVQADVKAMFGLITVHGTFRLKSGQVTIAEDPASSSVQAVIDAGSYDSGNAARDKDVTSAALLDASAHPEITFAAEGARQEGSDWVLRGTVNAHGTDDQVEVRVSAARVENGVARFQAAARLDRTSFGVTKKKGMVGNTVNVVIDAAGQPA